MQESYLGITIPEELLSTDEKNSLQNVQFINKTSLPQANVLKEFVGNIYFNKNKNGVVESAKFYDDYNILLKEVFYNGVSVYKIDYYKNNKKYIEEEYNKNLVEKRCFSPDGALKHSIKYEYNSKNKIISILRTQNDIEIMSKYDYDEFDRIKIRKIYVNSDLVIEQNYRYDILDRLSQYRDNNQTLNVECISTNNLLLKYSITCSNGIIMYIKNNFENDNYVNTEITINNKTIKVKSINFVDNIMLKQPQASEDDVSMVLSYIYPKNVVPITTSRTKCSDILNQNLNNIISIKSDNNAKYIPISIRKRLLYQNAICSNA